MKIQSKGVFVHSVSDSLLSNITKIYFDLIKEYYLKLVCGRLFNTGYERVTLKFSEHYLSICPHLSNR